MLLQENKRFYHNIISLYLYLPFSVLHLVKLYQLQSDNNNKMQEIIILPPVL